MSTISKVCSSILCALAHIDFLIGNEASYVLISVVRTTSPGFLKSQNRVNVMLTRCRAGMVIVSNRKFLRTTAAQYTLLGKLAEHWEYHHGRSMTWIDWKLVAENKADMPGVLAAHRPSTTSTINPSSAPIASIVRSVPVTSCSADIRSQLPMQSVSKMVSIEHKLAAAPIENHQFQDAFPSLSTKVPSQRVRKPLGRWANGSDLAKSFGYIR